jgi:DNA polymerase III delta prime subunit
MSTSSRADATPAYRGYRLQALYTLSRLLESNDSANLIFQPEGEEDLAIFDTNNNLLEVIQVKAYDENLSLSSLKPKKPDSFFYRVNKLLESNIGSSLKISIVSFGAIGQEMLQACQVNGRERKRVAQKLSEYGFLSEVDADKLLAQIQLISVEETTLTEKVYESLRDSLTGVEPECAFDMLNFWLYVCAENKCKLTQGNVIEKVNTVGRFLAERAAHHKEWFTSIVPIEDSNIEAKVKVELSNEFYRGISARYEHILADVDVLRYHKMQEVFQKFQDNKVVIVHGASGQGKTTLAYRYLHEFFPDQWRFKVQLIDSREHALSIATALAGQADALGIPIVVYLDVSPNDSGWTELVRQLSTHKTIHVLVTVREEDFRRASISGAELQFSEVDLTFNLTEAQEIYQSLTNKRVPAEFLSFEEAWNKFGGEGPLMEFVYLVTQGNSLRERLSQQVRRLEDEVREGKLASPEIELLRVVSVASAFEARLKVKPLVKHLGLAVPRRTFELFEKEYLIKRSDDGSLIQGLHPIRSAILADILTDPTFSQWSESASGCLPFIFERDVESFLLHAFSRHRGEIEPLLHSLASYQPEQWTAIAGVTRALIWLGILEYTETNKQLIEEIFEDAGSGFWVVLDSDISDATPGWGNSFLRDLGHMLPLEGRRRIEAFKARQTDKKQVFLRVKTWLSSRTQKPTEPLSDTDWSGMAETTFWIGHLEVAWPLTDWLSEAELDKAVGTLPIEILADLTVGLSYGYKEGFNSWLGKNRSKLISRFRRDTQTVALEDDGQKLTAHFIIDFQQSNGSQPEGTQEAQAAKNRLHEEAAQRYGLLRKLLPDRELYACQGYGHRLWSDDLPFDDTQKTGIPKSALPLLWLTAVNSTFRGIAEQSFRPKTWQEYSHLIFQLRMTVLQAIQQLENALEIYFRKKNSVRLIGKLITPKTWDSCRKILRTEPLLPFCALDEWGFVDEVSSDSALQRVEEGISIVSKKGIVIKRYKSFLSALREYTRTLSNFFDQSINTLALNPALGRGEITDATRQKLFATATQQGMNPNVIRIAPINLARTVKMLPQLQKEFRNLLAQFISSNKLNCLEEEEQKIFKRAWSIWYQFTFNPELHWQNAVQKSLNQLEQAIRKLRNNLRQETQNISSDILRFNVLSQDIPWEQELAIWLVIDGENAVDVYNSIEDIIIAIRRAFNKLQEPELLNSLAEFHWSHVVIVPLVRGKSLNATAWRISLLVLLLANEQNQLKWWNFVQHPIPPDALTSLGITIWTAPRLEVANKLIASMSQLSLFAAHVRDFRRLPDLDRQGLEQIQQYFQSLTVPMNEAFDLVANTYSEIGNFCIELLPSQYENRPNLVAAVQALKELYEYILPTSDFQEQVIIDFERMVEWANQLEIGQEYAFRTYLLWASDVLDEAEVEFQKT